jgi:hypothetical protein
MTTTPTTQATQSEITELRMRQAEDHAYLQTLLKEMRYIKEDLKTEMSEADRTYYEHALANCRVRVADLQVKMLVRLKHI